MKIVLFSFLVFIMVTQSAVCQKAEIVINTPETVAAGSEFLLSVIIPENYLEGVARLQLELPNGMTATLKQSMNADFKFEKQKATFQWLNFPVNQEVEVIISIIVAPSLEGYSVIKGIANWIKDTEPLRANIYPKVITVLQGNDAASNQMKLTEPLNYKFENFHTEGVACIRQVPYEKEGEIIVNIMISKGSLNKYGKIQEKIPPGYKVENIKGQNAIFVYNNNQNIVKYLWMNMPEAEKFVVSYKLIPNGESNGQTPFLIYGTFYYAENNITNTINIQERGIVLD